MSDKPQAIAASRKFLLWLAAIIALGVALSLPAVFGGYMMDDYWYFETEFI